MAEWKRWKHKEDPTIVYEAREYGGGYEFRRPGDKGILGWSNAEDWRIAHEPEDK